jgi:endonuclease/exonuclease/phosphatase family metal-dependent hydrolase
MTRVLALNLQHGLSRTGKPTTAAELADAVGSLDVDVVALQEVDRDQPRSGEVDQAAVVAAALGLPHVRFAATLGGDVRSRRTSPRRWGAHDGAGYGLAIASRWPVSAWFVKRLPRLPTRYPVLTKGRPRLREDEQRGAVAAVLQTPDGPLSVCSAHLSLLAPVAVAQSRALLRAMATMPTPALVCGDLDLDPWLLDPLSPGWQLPRARTFPSVRPRRQIDHVLVRGARVASVDAVELGISDHRGLLVDVDHR